MSGSPESADMLLKRLEWSVVRKLDGLLQGDYRTLFRGFGLDLADLREYQTSDDVRHIDWNVTARTEIPHVRVYNEDREVTAWFVLDLSPSVDFGSTEVSKRQVLAEFTAVLARLLTRQGNRIGAVLYDGLRMRVVPPRSGRAQVLHMLSTVLGNPRLLRAPRTDLGAFLGRVPGLVQRRSLVFVVSDFIGVPGWEKALFNLGRRHEVLAVRLVDPADTAIPELGMAPFEDPETGEQIFVDTGDPVFRARFLAEATRNEDVLMEAFGAAGCDVLELSTGDDLLGAIGRFADMRKAQRTGSSGAIPPHLAPQAEAAS